MQEKTRLQKVFEAMIRHDHGDPKRIQHFTKVHAYAHLIALEEGLSPDQVELIEAAALVHDIGIREAEQRYGYQNGKLQEQEGPAPAGELLTAAGFSPEVVRRVKYLVGHHHTYTNIDGIDYQILVEADFLVNLYEDGETKAVARMVREKIFRTPSGIRLLETMFGI